MTAAKIWSVSEAEFRIAEPSRRERLPRRLVAAVVATLRAWRVQQQHRRELAAMSARDFADLGVSPTLARDEARKWPWQAWAPHWQDAEAARQARFAARRRV